MKTQASQKGMQAWYQCHLGQLLAQAEREQLDEILPDLFGYHLLQIGTHGCASLCQGSRISHHVQLATHTDVAAGIYAHAARLPFASESVDVCVVTHILEFDPDPHAVLREIDRILIPEGHIVVLGFNPFSWWGIRRVLSGWREKVPWSGKFYSRSRIRDWLSVLGFDCTYANGVFFRPPFKSEKIMHKLEFMERYMPRWLNRLAGAYVIVAKKRTSTLTPIGPRWRAEPKKIVNGGLVEPSARGIHCDRNR